MLGVTGTERWESTHEGSDHGGLGFLGQRLARTLLNRGTLNGASGAQERIDELVLFDAVVPDRPPAGLDDERVSLVAGDVADGRRCAC